MGRRRVNGFGKHKEWTPIAGMMVESRGMNNNGSAREPAEIVRVFESGHIELKRAHKKLTTVVSPSVWQRDWRPLVKVEPKQLPLRQDVTEDAVRRIVREELRAMLSRMKVVIDFAPAASLDPTPIPQIPATAKVSGE